MSAGSPSEEERLAHLLRALPPAPQAWVQAAQELPELRRTVDELVARAEQDAAFRLALLADLETALAEAGHEPEPQLIASVRLRLRG